MSCVMLITLASCMQSGKAEYKSVTVSLDATAEEFTDFYLDDDIRPTWVNSNIDKGLSGDGTQCLALHGHTPPRCAVS